MSSAIQSIIKNKIVKFYKKMSVALFFFPRLAVIHSLSLTVMFLKLDSFSCFIQGNLVIN